MTLSVPRCDCRDLGLRTPVCWGHRSTAFAAFFDRDPEPLSRAFRYLLVGNPSAAVRFTLAKVAAVRRPAKTGAHVLP